MFLPLNFFAHNRMTIRTIMLDQWMTLSVAQKHHRLYNRYSQMDCTSSTCKCSKIPRRILYRHRKLYSTCELVGGEYGGDGASVMSPSSVAEYDGNCVVRRIGRLDGPASRKPCTCALPVRRLSKAECRTAISSARLLYRDDLRSSSCFCKSSR